MNSDKTLFCKKRLSPLLCKHDNHGNKKETRKRTNKNLYNSRNHKSAD